MPRMRAAAVSSPRRIAPSSARDETGTPEFFPASPSVDKNRLQRTPDAAYLAIVPPTANVSSSGCARTQASERVTRRRSIPAIASAQQTQDEQEHVQQIEIDVDRGRHVVIRAILPR